MVTILGLIVNMITKGGDLYDHLMSMRTTMKKIFII